MAHDVEGFDDPHELIFRAVFPDDLNDDGSVDPSAFRGDQDSVNRGKYSQPLDVLKIKRFNEGLVIESEYADACSVKFECGEQRDWIQILIAHSPSLQNRAHCHFYAMKSNIVLKNWSDYVKRQYRSRIARQFKVHIPPD